MTDREKVIKGLECCAHTDGSNCKYCPYDITGEDCTALMAMDALALLKEQEPLRQPEIVRCKDCKHATMTADGKMCKYCAMDTDDFGDQRDVYHDANWFCADGERKSADEILMEKWDADPLG